MTFWRPQSLNITGSNFEKSITTGYSRSLGPELVANTFWERLGFDRILASGGFDQKQLALAKAVIIGRLVAPGSERRTLLKKLPMR